MKLTLPPSPHPRQRGYTMALLLGLCVIAGIMLMKGLPNLQKMHQRNLEEELIFRGTEYAKALRLYRMKTGNYPTSLEDLMKVRPRLLRKLYKDPITNDEFDVITAVQPGATGVKTGLPIAGVKSKSNLDSVIMWNGKTLHSEWAFLGTDDLFGAGRGTQMQFPQNFPQGGGGSTRTPTPSSESGRR